MDRKFEIDVVDTVFDPNASADSPRKVYVRRSTPRPLYKVWLYLSGYELPIVQSVTYILHPTFPDPIREVTRTLSNPNCQLVIWTWGLFEIIATIKDKSDRIEKVQHRLGYDKELKRSGISYVYE
jgi:hypothetical protein